jgi:transcription elongation factor GreA
MEYITPEKKKELEEELDFLKSTKRQEILDAIEFAKSLGDLSENAEYHTAREEQARLEDRIGKIEYMLAHAEVVSHKKSVMINIGSKVTLEKKGGKEKKMFALVGAEEADTKEGKISHNSPLGSALMGHKKDEVITFSSPNGKIEYKIIDVS